MKIIYLVTLFIIGTTANVVPRQSKGCECDSFISENGWGNCEKYESDGRTMCYVKNPSTSTCPDKKASTTDVGKMWSYKACESATNTKPTTGVYYLSQENSLCDSMRAKSYSKVDTEEECREAVDGIRKEVPGARFMKVETVAEGTGFPRGCYLWVANKGVYFNTNDVRAVHKGAKQICKEDGVSDDCDRSSDCAGQETCQGGKCVCGNPANGVSQKSCLKDKAAPTCDISAAGVATCICGRNDLNGDGSTADANGVVNTCALNAAAPTCSELGHIDNPANFQCNCGSKGPCKDGTICEKDVDGKTSCVVKCPAACKLNELCDTFHKVCRCGTKSTCQDYPRGPVCDPGNPDPANLRAPECVCRLEAGNNLVCTADERCQISADGNPANNVCRCGNREPCGARGICIKGECRCGNVGGDGCPAATPTCTLGANPPVCA